ncbi:MAG: hypothetical protein WDN24_13200 [Sphingomonas sp.]
MIRSVEMPLAVACFASHDCLSSAAIAPMSPVNSSRFISIASALSLCIASIAAALPAFSAEVCRVMMCADSRELP